MPVMTELQASISAQMGRLEVLNTCFNNATTKNLDTHQIQQERIATSNLLADLITEQYVAVNDGKYLKL